MMDSSLILPPSDTIEDVLADLAGAVIAFLDLQLIDRGQESCQMYELIPFIACAQWQNSGFMIEHAKEVSQGIIDSYLEMLEPDELKVWVDKAKEFEKDKN